MKPRVLLVGRTRYRLPLDESLQRKFDALTNRIELRVLAGSADGAVDDEEFRLVRTVRPRALDGIAFHTALPMRVARELRRFRPDVVLVQGAHEAAAVLFARSLARSGARIVLDVHGDWRLATRLYGSHARRLLSGVADTSAGFAVRRVDGVRAVSEFTSALVREAGGEVSATFPAFIDLEPFLSRPPAPLPARPAALFVGVLERYKDVDGLAAAWRLAAPRLPGAELRIVGTGSRRKVVDRLLRDLPEQTRWSPELSADEIAAELDRATCLVLPSPREGMGRVIVEAFARGRPVVASRAGAVPELVRHEVNGLLVDVGDPGTLADALVRVLSDDDLASRLAAAARPSVAPFAIGPEQYADSLLALVAATASDAEPEAAPPALVPAGSK
jgi:glycosyltransferase involved in cell wall biosynthesis